MTSLTSFDQNLTAKIKLNHF